ncbi:hypothetical protein [Neisseria weaveri]|uniref:hypothetical protein n=1 Tax=Neisseria weaveri TaxID=28091 RepID=UPI001F482E69|nr:hypothetical protein [Neisseria weaveri]
MRVAIILVMLLAGVVFTIVLLDSVLSIANGESDWGSETFKMWLVGGIFAFMVLGSWLAIYSKASDGKNDRSNVDL